MTIRLASTADSEALLHIYAQYIDTPITFEYDCPSRSEFARRIADITMHYPYLVYEEEGRPLGYAYAHRHMGRAAYQWNVELSVYLAPGAVSRGIGTRLYLALLDILRLQGVRTAYSGVTVPNEKSRRLHLGLGFSSLGIYHSTGYKCGKWYDVEWFEKQLLPYAPGPAPVRPICDVPSADVQAILRSR